MDNKLYTVMYHYTRDLANSRYPKIKGLDKNLFIQQLDFFKENFNVVTMEQVIEAWNTPNGCLPERALLLTFDDGYIDNYLTAFPLLKERGLQGSFFIPGKIFTEKVLLDVNKIHFILAMSNVKNLIQDVNEKMNYYRGLEFDFPSNEELWEKWGDGVQGRFDSGEVMYVKRLLQIALPKKLRRIISSELFQKYVGIEEEKFARELYMNQEQIRFMKREGMYIGCHGYDHSWLAGLTEEELHMDMDKMLDVMGEFIEKDNWVLNYPYGNYNKTVISYAKSRGCVLGMTIEARIGEIGKNSRFLIPRLDCNDFPPVRKNLD